ncbi:LacI family DNA-binding transcriptional regulator [Sanguibacter sp. 4.1]|uniref:LacI family DNA-binding transcriptional regulator n=1 Tax=Sanguibacter biliveldensis TaxID=3030830 RepID=A0AAF1C2G3_9MICO|nr:LacI family DNA-binding transcriptional regulator [Sanguibacter sp. 4.1]WPF82055.1 LacI family DNA-binding transcriptional regulator [Sanguibacter sp. 4.1]
MPRTRSTTSPARGSTTATEVARAAGVSQSAVSLVMSGKAAGRIAPATAAHIQEVARSLGYRPNVAARTLRTGTSGLLGLVVLDASHPFYGHMLSAADDAAAGHGLALTMIQTRGHEDSWEQRLADQLSSGHLAGAIVCGERLSEGSPLRDRRDRLVFVEVPEPGMRSVALATAAAAADAVALLASHGHSEIAYLAADYPSAVFASRVADCADAARQHGVTLRTDPRWRATFDVEPATAAAGRLLDDGARAVVCDDDLLALALHRVAAERRVTVPDDLEIVGVGDLDTARLVSPELTTVRLPATSIAAAAVALLLDALAGRETPETTTVETPLVERRTTRSV